MRSAYRTATSIALVITAACSAGSSTEGSRQALARPGPWRIPDEVLAAGDAQYVPYEGAGPWRDGEGCSGRLEPGTGLVLDYLGEHFPQITHIGGYNCRPIGGSTNTSVHGVGRALDLHIATVGDARDADNDLGDPVGNWLIDHAEILGIQFIIWDEWSYGLARAQGAKGRAYGGVNLHHDHLHVELSTAAAAQTENWFEDLVQPPLPVGCDPLPPDGGLIDDAGSCFSSYGPPAYWRVEQGVGHGGGLHWTNAFESDEPSNWARWTLAVQQAGRYRLEVWLTDPFNAHRHTRYALQDARGSREVLLDQAARTGWVTLTEAELVPEHAQWLSIYDATDQTLETDTPLVADAVRLTRLQPAPEDGGVAMSDADTAEPGPRPAQRPATEIQLPWGTCCGALPDRPEDAAQPPESGVDEVEPTTEGNSPPPFATPAPEPLKGPAPAVRGSGCDATTTAHGGAIWTLASLLGLLRRRRNRPA